MEGGLFHLKKNQQVVGYYVYDKLLLSRELTTFAF